jgi:hypothetical protein
VSGNRALVGQKREFVGMILLKKKEKASIGIIFI